MDTSDIAKREVVYRMPGMDAVEVRRDLEFAGADGSALALDLYRPSGSDRGSLPAVVFVSGFPDPGLAARRGCPFKELGQYTSWARLAAASGLAAVSYTNRDPEADLDALFRHLQQNGAGLGIDPGRLAVWAGSGNVPNALALLMGSHAAKLRCAALYYGFMLDRDDSTAVADASRAFGFVNPSAGRSPDALPAELPLLVVRAGRDENPGLNDTIDRFVADACAYNLRLRFVNHPTGPHAFDIDDPGRASEAVIASSLEFLRRHLAA